MKRTAIPDAQLTVTLQDVLDRITEHPQLSANRKRDLRSAVMTFSKTTERLPSSIPLNIPEIRAALDQLASGSARMSAKRMGNLRSDIGAALDASGLVPLLRTANVTLTASWQGLLASERDPGIRRGLSRFARWAGSRGIVPENVDSNTIDQFAAALQATSLARNVIDHPRTVAKAWNELATHNAHIQPVAVAEARQARRRVSWDSLSPAFCRDVENYLQWCSVPDPMDEQARARKLAAKTLRLRREQIHSMVTSAAHAGIDVARWTSLADMVEAEVYKSLLRVRWAEDGQRLSAYTHGLAGLLVAIASEWVKAPAVTIAALKSLRRRLGKLPSGLTEKNKAFLRKVSDPELSQALLHLPEQLWRRSLRDLSSSRRPFIDLQTALAIDILLHVPLRMENLSALKFGTHLHWPRGRGKPALITFKPTETKNSEALEFELPKTLADRLWMYKTEIVPKVTGIRTDAVFVTWNGTPRKQETIALGIEKVVFRNLGLKLTPHQFRHFAAKIILDSNPGAIVQVKELLGHKNIKTTSNFYAGIDTQRAGRAHAALIEELRGTPFKRKRSAISRL